MVHQSYHGSDEKKPGDHYPQKSTVQKQCVWKNGTQNFGPSHNDIIYNIKLCVWKS